MTDHEYRDASAPDPGTPLAGRPHSEERILHTEKIQIERKVFVFSLRENSRGRFLRITEDVGGRRDAIIVPAPGLREFGEALEAIALRAREESPAPAAV
ncbi:MAG: RNA-binding protein [Verrucomicrobia bacterium]|nr:RNA-binding protein [Verrucomicrobiota bacterium]